MQLNPAPFVFVSLQLLVVGATLVVNEELRSTDPLSIVFWVDAALTFVTYFITHKRDVS